MSSDRRWAFARLRPRAEWAAMPLEDAAASAFEALLPLGALGVEERDEPSGRSVLAWLPADAARPAVERALADAGVACDIEELGVIEDPGWVEQWNASLRPIDVGRRLTILPRPGEAPAGRIALVIEPGRAFGTGHHESTRLALAAIEERVRDGMSVLDVGTGSGILALAAARLGAASVEAVDVDREAIEVARENLGGQPEAPRIRLAVASDPARLSGRHDLVVANIQADVILRLLPGLLARLAPSGALILSGLLAPDEEPVGRSLASASLAMSWRADGEWRCVVAERTT